MLVQKKKNVLFPVISSEILDEESTSADDISTATLSAESQSKRLMRRKKSKGQAVKYGWVKNFAIVMFECGSQTSPCPFNWNICGTIIKLIEISHNSNDHIFKKAWKHTFLFHPVLACRVRNLPQLVPSSQQHQLKILNQRVNGKGRTQEVEQSGMI